MAAMWIVLAVTATAGQTQPVPPAELVRRTIQNEVNDSDSAVKYMFRNRKETPHGSQTKLMVETRDAMAAIVIAIDDQPLSAQQRQAETDRVTRIIKDPAELRKRQKQESDDSERITRIMKALPDAFLYEGDGTEAGRPGVGRADNGLLRLKFRPNPGYEPPSRVEQILTGMQGTMLIDADKNRIARIDGTLSKDVSFGWGFFGHLDRGGRFLVEQGEVAANYWAISRMDLSFTGKILLFKGLNIKSSEVYSDFRPVSGNLTFAQGVELLKHEEGLAQNCAQCAASQK
jgi:hypothetical protein